jgi:hypothetical protein
MKSQRSRCCLQHFSYVSLPDGALRSVSVNEAVAARNKPMFRFESHQSGVVQVIVAAEKQQQCISRRISGRDG